MNEKTISAELKRIAKQHGGLLRPADVVEAAKPKTSPLHGKFEWNDGEAAQRYRLWQARELIRVTVDYLGPANEQILTRVFVSLTPDRRDGGYREISAVMSDAHQRRQLLSDAMDEMDRFREKYAGLKELAEVFAAMRRVGRKKAAA